MDCNYYKFRACRKLFLERIYHEMENLHDSRPFFNYWFFNVFFKSFFQVQILDAFILSCNASLQTVSRVTMCPSDMSAYEEAVKKKNCSSMAADAHAVVWVSLCSKRWLKICNRSLRSKNVYCWYKYVFSSVLHIVFFLRCRFFHLK